MAEGAEVSHCIYEEREENMVSPKDEKRTRRVARFLKPCALHFNKAVAPPSTPLLCEVLDHNLQQWSSRVLFKGWKMPQAKWDEWVNRLAGKYCSIWNQAGICDAILSSRYEIRCTNKNILHGLVEFWSSETNTFVFPWGEATFTLEDMMVLGGFSVLGRPVTRPVNGLLVEIVEEMEKKRVEISRTKAKKACQFVWIKHFMELQNEYKYEHVAFLSLWLSRFVFPSLPEACIGRHVFPIAAQLSQGTRLALAPAVLSGLYKDLSLLKKQALSCREEISVPGPFQLLQLWALERFQPLLKNSPNALKPGEPRAARWHRLPSGAISLPLVRTVLKLQENFQWRPYAADLINWSYSSYYTKNKPSFFHSAKHSDENLRSYIRCLCASELVGVEHCKEKYFPNRVAMQFGMDQDLPGEFSKLYFAPGTDVGFFVPPRSFEPSVSARYLHWWKISKSARADTIEKHVKVAIQKIEKYNASIAERNVPMHKASPRTLERSKPEESRSYVIPEVPGKSNHTVQRKASATPQFPKQVKKESPLDYRDDDHIPLSERLRHLGNKPACLHKASTTSRPTKFVSSTSPVQDKNVKKRKLATTTEGLAKKINAGDFAKNVVKIAKKGRKGSDNKASVEVGVPFRMEHKHKIEPKVSGKDAAREGKKAMAKGSLKNCMGADDPKRMPKGFLKNPVAVDDCMVNATNQTQGVGLLMRVQNIEKILGVKT
ncbi:unnamed protein product [Prunus armeniaca]|uniref:Aminotransferase-like plant mobile domain-containing protein n=1 Tax=Prunus armeniaca TaxID=36596 RepID=A0A6J5XAS9_PRUAR|nr:unnamed protein product [Prunus armeniaca]